MGSLYFVGIKTRGSLIHRLIRDWTALAAVEVDFKPVDLQQGLGWEPYVDLLASFRADAGFLGAQVTSHKTMLYEVRAHLDEITPLAGVSREIGAVIRRGRDLVGMSSDMVALQEELPDAIQANPAMEPGVFTTLILGGGGAATAMACSLLQARLARRVIISEVDAHRRVQLLDWASSLEYMEGVVRIVTESEVPAVLSRLDEGSLIVNATGMGKDSLGTPIPPDTPIPDHCTLWDLNYRGELGFLRKDKVLYNGSPAQPVTRDGLSYFVRNWRAFLLAALGAEDECLPFRQMFELAQTRLLA